jgi:RNA-directed DNA polymerase
MHERWKSDMPVVPAKSLNKAASVAAEVMEERGMTKGNTASETRPGHRAGPGVPSALDRVRQVARQDKDARSRRCCTMSPSTACGRRSGRFARRPRRAWTG